MSTRTARNFKTLRVTAGSSYTEIPISCDSYFAIYAPGTDVLLSIGHNSAGDTTSIDIPADGSFELEAGITGSIQVKSSGADVDCSVVYA